MLTPADLHPIRDLYLRGQYRQALAAGERFGPVRTWQGPAGRLLGGRLAIQLGGPRLGRRLHLVAFRESPAYPEAVYYHARYRLEKFGPLACWEFLKLHPDWSESAPDLRADWLAVHALACGRLRDFDRAEKYLAQADAISPTRPWLRVERASVMEQAGRPAEALAAARQSLELQAWFRPGVQAVSHLMRKQGDEVGAVEFLTEADRHLESGIVAAQLATGLYDLGRDADAGRYLDRYAELSPLVDVDTGKWLAARRADVAYRLGDFAAAERHARSVGEDFYTAFADRLAVRSAASGGRKPAEEALSAGGTTCDTGGVPSAGLRPPLALLPDCRGADAHTSLAKFWATDLPPRGDHPPPPDGLPDAADRVRFEAAGWLAVEFRLTADAVAAVVARGVPVVVSLVEAGYSQPRLIVAADPVRGSVSLADGSERFPAEAPAAALAERYKVFGPRCLAVAPPGKHELLAGLDLPDAAGFDSLHAVQAALLAHDFDRAATLMADLPPGRWAKWAAVAWARATAHPVLLRQALESLLDDFPGEPTLTLGRAAALRDLGLLADRQAALEAAAARPDPEPLVLQSLAQMLLPDPTERARAERLLRRSVRLRPAAAPGYFLLGTLFWETQRFAAAVDRYRFAACLDDGEEQFAAAYSKAAAAAGLAPEALRLFQQRAVKPVPPAAAVKSLADALADRDEPEQAWSALDRAVEKLRAVPSADLGELLLHRAERHAAAGRADQARADLDAAKPHADPLDWLKAAARVARVTPDYTAALSHLRAIAAKNPLDPDAHRPTVALLADTAGRPAARRYLTDLVEQYPQVYPLARLRAEFFYPDGGDDALAATEHLLTLSPDDAWTHRQLAVLYADRKQDERATRALAHAAVREPGHPSQFAVTAHVHRRAERHAEALEAIRAGIRANPDQDLSVFELVALARDGKEKRAALKFVRDRLRSGPHTGDGLIAYFEQAARAVNKPEQLDRLAADMDRFLDDRPDLWQAWSAAVQVRLLGRRADEALALARDAVERFPLSARPWVDLAEACQANSLPDERLEALAKAAAAAPGWVPAARELSEELAEADRTDEAVVVLEKCVERNPADPLAHWALAERLWETDRGREALDRAKRAVRLDPGHDPRAETAWLAVQAWAERLDVPDEAAELARALTRDRAGDPRSWLRLARSLAEPDQMPEALAALDTVVALDPRTVEAHDLRAERLAAMGRYDDALAAARPPALANDLPLVLQGRAAWVEARRGNFAAAIPPMQRLVAVDPEYIWGWQQLAEWHNETGKPASYLEAAGELCRLRPEHPLSLTMRGEARVQTGDREAGKADLRDALRLHPGYSPAAVLLFDACLADGESKEARAALSVLQEHLTGPEVLVKQVQFLARTEDEDGAIRAFAELCQTPGDAPPVFLQLAVAELAGAGLSDRAADELEKAWTGDEFNPWAAIYWLDTPQGTAAADDKRLSACDAVLKAYPGFVPGYDRKAEHLAGLGRFDDALAACAPPLPGDVPVPLRGRAAWVLARQGDKPGAIDRMNALLAAEPDYLWGWRQLTQWYDALGKQKDCLYAADQLVRLSPRDPLALAIRGEARRAVGDHRGARDDFAKAFDIDPDFEAAGLQLVTAHLAADDLDGAAAALEKLSEHTSGPLVLLRGVQVAVRKGDLPAARDGLRTLATDSDTPRPVLREAVQALTEAGWAAEADDELGFAVEAPDGTPAAAGLWVERQVEAGQAGEAADALAGLAARNPAAGREAVLAFVDEAEGPEVAATVQRFSDLLRADAEGWARAGGALVEAKQYPMAAAWLGDWPGRDGVEAWMLRPLADALRAIDRDADALAVCKAALALPEGDDGPADFRAWLALDAALAGDGSAAAAYLAAVDADGRPDGVKLVLAMARAVLDVKQTGRVAFPAAKAALKDAAAACEADDLPPGIGRWWRRAVARLAADAGGLPAVLWAAGQRLRPWVRGG